MMLIGCLLVLAMSAAAQSVKSESDNGLWSQDEKQMIRIGLAIAPVPLNMARKDKDMVGLGGYTVNVTGGAMAATAMVLPTQTFPPATPTCGNRHLIAPRPPIRRLTWAAAGDLGRFPVPTHRCTIAARN